MTISILAIVLALLAALIAGLVGAFALLRRMSLAGDAVSHIALPGIGVAYLVGFQPMLGAAATLLLGALVIWRIERKTALNTESAVGVVFTASLSIGALLTPKQNLEEALFWRPEKAYAARAGRRLGALGCGVVGHLSLQRAICFNAVLLGSRRLDGVEHRQAGSPFSSDIRGDRLAGSAVFGLFAGGRADHHPRGHGPSLDIPVDEIFGRVRGYQHGLGGLGNCVRGFVRPGRGADDRQRGSRHLCDDLGVSTGTRPTLSLKAAHKRW